MNQSSDHASNAPEFLDNRHAPEFIDNRQAPEVVQSPSSQPTPFEYRALEPDLSPLKQEKPRSDSQRIAGLPTWAFWLVIAAVSLVVVGGSVGGAVGSSLSDKAHSLNGAISSSRTATSTGPITSTASSASSSAVSSAASSSTSSSTAGSTSSAIETTDCPSSNGTEYTPIGAGGGTGLYTFTKYCASTPVVLLMDITEAYVQTFDLCIDLCSSWNDYEDDGQTGSSQLCVASQYLPSGGVPGNCWIKNSSSLTKGLETSSVYDTATLNDASSFNG